MADTTAIQRASVSDAALWTETDLALVRNLYAKDTDDAEWRLFLYMANKYQLDPMIKQIWCVKYKNQPAQIFAGRDGFLAIAHRSNCFDGMVTKVRIEQVPILAEYTYYDQDTKTRKTGGIRRDYQYVARTTVYHKAMRHPVIVEVWEEEYSTGRNLWASKPRTMIGKVAECQALRRAFDISGIYDPAEMGDRADPNIVDSEAREIPGALPERVIPNFKPLSESRPALERHQPVKVVTEPTAIPDDVRAAMTGFTMAADGAKLTEKAQRSAWLKAHYPGRALSTLTVADWEAAAELVRIDPSIPEPDDTEAA